MRLSIYFCSERASSSPRRLAEINTVDLRRTPVSCLATFPLLTVAPLAELQIVAPLRPQHAEPITAGFCFPSSNNTGFALLLLVLPATPPAPPHTPSSLPPCCSHTFVAPPGSAHSASLRARVNCLVCICLSPILLLLLLLHLLFLLLRLLLLLLSVPCVPAVFSLPPGVRYPGVSKRVGVVEINPHSCIVGEPSDLLYFGNAAPRVCVICFIHRGNICARH